MNQGQGQFVQVPCVKCGTVVWISPAAGMGYCPSCQTPNQIPAMGTAPTQAAPAYGAAPGGYGAPPAAPGGYGAPPPAGAPPAYNAPPGAAGPPVGGYGAPPGASPVGASPVGAPPGPPGGYGPPVGAPGAPGAPGGYGAPVAFKQMGSGPSKFGAIGGGVGAVIVAVVVGLGKGYVKNIGKDPGKASLSDVGLNAKKGDPDKMISAAASQARKWKADAAFRSINILGLAADGTTDLTEKNVNVEFFSPSGVSAFDKTKRDDSIKKYTFNGDGMLWDTRMIWGPTERATQTPTPTPIPTCTAKQLAAAAVKAGALKQGATTQASLDPNFSMAWVVQSPGGPKSFDAATCAPVK